MPPNIDREIGTLSAKLDQLLASESTRDNKLDLLGERIEVLNDKLDKHIQEEAIALAIKKEQEDRQKAITKWFLKVIGSISLLAIAAVLDDWLSPFFQKK